MFATFSDSFFYLFAHSLERAVRASRWCWLRLALAIGLLAMLFLAPATCAWAEAGALLKLLQSGRLPAERQGAVIEMVCHRGNSAELAYVYQQVLRPDAYAPKLRRQTVEWLTAAAANRKTLPDGDLTAVQKLLNEKGIEKGGGRDEAWQLAVIRLASAWKVKGVARDLEVIAADEKASEPLQSAAIDGLVSLGDAECQQAILKLAADGKSPRIKILATAGLARLNLAAAAPRAAAVFITLTAGDDSGPILDAFLGRDGGAEKLAAALQGQPLAVDAAKVALRYMYSMGRSDAELSNVLSQAAGVALDTAPPSQEEVAKIAAEVAAQGNAERGELVFRRADVNCLKCHAVSRAGGDIGPDLSAVGKISPVDYVVNSILNPNLAIKENFVTRVVLTSGGEVITGIQKDRDEKRLILRDAGGKTITIPIDDIESEKEGKSLMPQGLTKFLTHQEFLDLAKFISELGRPGPYDIRATPTIQRWRVLKRPAPELAGEVPNVENVRQFILDAPAESWAPAYAKVAGELPLAELRPADSAGAIFLQGELLVTVAGPLQVELFTTAATQLWVAAEPFESQRKVTVDLPEGRHKITLRLALPLPPLAELKVEITRPAGSAAQFDVVGGP